jgi:hypothetical protein
VPVGVVVASLPPPPQATSSAVVTANDKPGKCRFILVILIFSLARA